MNYEPVDGKTTTAALTGLNEATMYDVAVKASTAKGFGPLGPKENGTTLGDGEYSKYIVCLTLYQSGIFIRIIIFNSKIVTTIVFTD